MIRTALISLIAPVSFLIFIVGFSILFSIRLQTNDPALISQMVEAQLSWILMMVQITLFVLVYYLLNRREIDLSTILDAIGIRNWVIGGLVGFVIFLLYLLFLEPLLVYLQNIWDYIPAGSVVSRISSPLWVFFVANCLMAPLAEELFYRGWLLPQLMDRLGAIGSVVLASLLFGLLHWAGGIWYVLLTAIFVGIPFSILFVLSRNIIMPLAAHLALNAFEFGYAIYLSQ